MAKPSPVAKKLEKSLASMTKGSVDMALVRQMVKEAKAAKEPVMPAQVLAVVMEGVETTKEEMEDFVKVFLEYWMTT
jgi:hypothetical protein